MSDDPLRLIVAGQAGRLERSTATLLESLIARIATLSVVSGANAVGSLMAGFAALGREASLTADGVRIREALTAGRAGNNVRLLWARLGIADAASRLPPTPVLVDLRNDVALLVAPDLATALDNVERRPTDSAIGPVRSPESVDPVDVLVGLWAFGGELTGAIEALAAPTLRGAVEETSGAAALPPEGPVLR